MEVNKSSLKLEIEENVLLLCGIMKNNNIYGGNIL